MPELNLTGNDLQEINHRGTAIEDIESQIETFKKGIPYLKLLRPCAVGDGITIVPEDDMQQLIDLHSEAALSGRLMKFVPASGAATRMFKMLHSIYSRFQKADVDKMRIDQKNKEYDTFLYFIKHIKEFAFYNDLASLVSKKGYRIDDLVSKGKFKKLIDFILTPEGFNYATYPKGMIQFHRNGDHSRTAIEEHLVEAAEYVCDRNNECVIHFTISPHHEELIKHYLAKVVSRYEDTFHVTYKIDFSFQEPSTDTIAVDMENRPFRDHDGGLVFRPGGHGALLKNLNSLKGDIVFIKNIDNVVTDRLKADTVHYKKMLCGYLVDVQKTMFTYLERLTTGDVDENYLSEIFEYAGNTLSIMPPAAMANMSEKDKIDFLISKLNRPLRVCGMVPNTGEPGGGPFWVEHGDKTVSLQVVESSQVDMKSTGQVKIWHASTHFNPVDIVCGVKDYKGNPFNLMAFSDPDTGFISVKSKEGRELKAFELPGLWNGAMGKWNTVFLEVPITTFNPVKTVMDLLRDEHTR